MSDHPRQPTEFDKHGVLRFKKNAIVEYLLEFSEIHGVSLNELAMMGFSVEDHRQFAQLIGYSESGYNSLTYAQRQEHES